MNVEVAHVSLPKQGELENGDRPFIRTDGEQRTLLAVIDGLGHGPGAAAVSQQAVEYLERASLSDAAHILMERLHDELSGSRGVAATLCIIRGSRLSVCAVGNVECRSVGVKLPLVFSPGILGQRVRKFRVCEIELSGPARFVLFSDGISSRVPIGEMQHYGPRELCDVVIDKYRRLEDDSTVMVADWGK